MLSSLRRLGLALCLLPLSLPLAATSSVNTQLPAKVQQALKANKIEAHALSVVLLPLNGPAVPPWSMPICRSTPPRP